MTSDWPYSWYAEWGRFSKETLNNINNNNKFSQIYDFDDCGKHVELETTFNEKFDSLLKQTKLLFADSSSPSFDSKLLHSYFLMQGFQFWDLRWSIEFNFIVKCVI